MTRHRSFAALLILSCALLAFAFYVARPCCTCVLGGNYDREAPGFSVPEDCPKHGSETP